MHVTILGCGGSTGVPSLGGADGRGDWGACDRTVLRNQRTRSSIVIEGPEGRILVDTSPDMRAQLLACAIPRIDAIIFTHPHADHITGLDDVRLLNRIAKKALPAYGTAHTMTEIQRRFDYAFRPFEGDFYYRPVLETNLIEPGQSFRACGLNVHTYDQDHHVMRTLGLRIGNFAYSTDVVRFSDSAWESLRGIDTWLVGCFQRKPHLTHAHVDLVLQWRERLQVRRTILTHMGIDLDYAWLKSNLPHDVEPAMDGQVLELTTKNGPPLTVFAEEKGPGA